MRCCPRAAITRSSACKRFCPPPWRAPPTSYPTSQPGLPAPRRASTTCTPSIRHARRAGKFRAGVAEAYGQRVALLSGEGIPPAAAASAYDASSLTLVQTAALEHEIAIGNLTTRLRDEAGDELSQFTRRVSTIVGDPDLLDADNPVGPSPLACGVYGGLDALEVDERVMRPLASLIADRLVGELEGLYRDLNRLLAGRGVARAARSRIVKSRDTGAASTRGRGVEPLPLPTGDVFAQMQMLLAQQRAMNGGSGAAPAASGEAGASGASGGATMATPATVDWLTAVQRGGAAAAGIAVSASAESMNVLHALRRSEAGQRLDPADATTCDLVALMFDHVFSDPRIPEAIKPLIAQLQVPTLKAAMLDRNFFSDEAHPARRMLDRLGSAAIGWRGAADASDPLYSGVQRIVTSAVAGFEDDLAALEPLTAEVDEIASLEEARAEAVAQRAIDVVTRRERIEAAQEAARDTVRQRLRETPVPEPVRHLAERIYRAVLSSAHEGGGAESAAWTSALEALDNLLWSVQPKSGAEERARLVKTLPGLIKAFEEGMRVAGFDDGERTAALDILAPHHAAAVRAPAARAASSSETGAAPAASEQPDEPQADAARAEPEAPPELQSETLTAEDVVVDTIAVAPRPGRKGRGTQARLEKGTWVEFTQPEGGHSARAPVLGEPAQGMHVFVNPDSARSLALDPDALEQLLARGDAQVLSAAPVVAEAMGYVMAELQQAGAAR
ncbi:MAG: DUF1631 domain-containing protein [Burkholderiales bacterium]|nr:DUF1631 domain-containing protein [Burkholderiales bacterium]